MREPADALCVELQALEEVVARFRVVFRSPLSTSTAPEIPAIGLRSSCAALETNSRSAISLRSSSVRSRTTARTALSAGSSLAAIA